MPKQVQWQIKPAEAADPNITKQLLSAYLAVPITSISGFYIEKQSIDARSKKQVWINQTLQVFVNEEAEKLPRKTYHFKQVNDTAPRVLVIGAGPAGLFAALQLLEAGIRPIIIERGKDVRNRRRDLAAMNKQGIVNPESNYCFGEGGAGTYSDGKLYTRSNKRGNLKRILELFVQFGAKESILYESHPHIGTNKLPDIISAMRNCIIQHGGEVHFETKLTKFIVENGVCIGAELNHQNKIKADALILATGHSARDIFELLHQQSILIESKPFALGVRIEHPQLLIDQIQYHCNIRDEHLPAASYSLVQQVQQKGVFSFCMCPGGIIAPAATSPGEIVVNGWSPSKRNNPYANSGMVVTIDEKEASQYLQSKARKSDHADPLLLMRYQQQVEQAAFSSGGGNLVAPAQRMGDFVRGIASSTLPDCSYLPGIQSVHLQDVLPPTVHASLRTAFKEFDKKMMGYLTNDAVIVATESRTSSPVRIPRDAETLEHLQIKGLYPCAEGAGYAGGIVSAAMDGERVANMIIQKIKRT